MNERAEKEAAPSPAPKEDLGSYQVSGRLLSSRGDDITLQTRSGSRIVVNRQETRTIRELRRRA